MPPNDNLERRRVRLLKAGVISPDSCHLCGANSSLPRSYTNFIGSGDRLAQGLPPPKAHGSCQTATADDQFSLLAQHELHSQGQGVLRTCQCYGHSYEQPYPLKVCVACVQDDSQSLDGRIRNCGICGVVSCDENCGVQLIEVTDSEEWNNKGCLECRGHENFNEIELFRKKPLVNGLPRVTRVCLDCLELFSLFSFGIHYHFKCRFFRCHRLLVPSHVVELKRFMKPFPLGLLPEELTNSIVAFLGSDDLFRFSQVSCAVFKLVESVSKEIVQRFNHELPSGPCQRVQIELSAAPANDTTGVTTANTNEAAANVNAEVDDVADSDVQEVRDNAVPEASQPEFKRCLVYAEGKNPNPLSPPEDGKTFVGVLNQMEKLVRQTYYFNFEIENGDDGCALRYLRKPNKLGFDRIFADYGRAGIETFSDVESLQVRGGTALVTEFKWLGSSANTEDGHNNLTRQTPRSVIFCTDKQIPLTGVHRVIVRYYCFNEGDGLGSVGLFRVKTEIDGTLKYSWANKADIFSNGRMEETILGIVYDADAKKLQFYKRHSRTFKMEAAGEGQSLTEEKNSQLYFAVSLSQSSASIKQNQVSIRDCSEKEFGQFLNHTVDRLHASRLSRLAHRSPREERLHRYMHHRHRGNGHVMLLGRDFEDDGPNLIAAQEVEDAIVIEEELMANEGADLEAGPQNWVIDI